MLKRTIQYVALAAAGLVVLAGAWFAFASPYKLYVIETGSMGQTIPPMSAVIVRTGEYRVGQVVTFTAHNETITHRLIKVLPDGTAVTKGDANASADESHVPLADIVGEVVYSQPNAGWWLMYFSRPSNLAAILALCFVVPYFWRLDNKQRERSEPACTPATA